jgi:hypothetical protein
MASSSLLQAGIAQLYTIKSGRAEGSGVTPLPHFFDEIECEADKDAVATACGVVNNTWCSERINQFQGHMMVDLMEVSGVTSDRKFWRLSFYSDASVSRPLLDLLDRELTGMRPDFYRVEVCSPRATRLLGPSGRWMSGLEVLVPRADYQKEFAELRRQEALRQEEEEKRRLHSQIINSGGAFFAPIKQAAATAEVPSTSVSRFANVDAGPPSHHAPSLRQPMKLKSSSVPSMLASTTPLAKKRGFLSTVLDTLLFVNPDKIDPE